MSPSLLDAASSRLEQAFGLSFPPERLLELLAEGARALAMPDGDSLAAALLAARLSRAQLQTVISILTVGETYFWREPASFDTLETEILPHLAETGRPAQLWSAGCSSGEEAYSLAIATLRAGLPGARVLGTDLDVARLGQAREGVYGRWSFRDTPPWLGSFFRAEGNRSRVRSAVRERVRFEPLNLVTDPYPGPFDVIFCRNVLMYLSPEAQQRVVEGFRASLAPGGWLSVSSCEANGQLFQAFTPVTARDSFFYRNIPPSQETPLRRPPSRARKPRPRRPVEAAPLPPTPDAGSLYLEALHQAEQGQTDHAAELLRRVLYLEPDHILGHYVLSGLYRNLGRGQAAGRHASVARKLMQAQPPERPLPGGDGLTCGRLLANLPGSAGSKGR